MVYYCHKCERQVPHAMDQPNGELLCSVCLDPFVEAMDNEEFEAMEAENIPQPPQQANQNPPTPHIFGYMAQTNQHYSFHSGFSSSRADPSRVSLRPPTLASFRFGAPSGPLPPFLDLSDGPDFFEAIFGTAPNAHGSNAQFNNFVVGDMHFNDLLARMHQQHEDRGRPPATKEAISQLKTKTLTKEEANVLTSHRCAVCQDEFLEKEEVTCLPCNHTYHKDCIVPWLARHCTCPVCRCEVKTSNAMSADTPIESPASEASQPMEY